MNRRIAKPIAPLALAALLALPACGQKRSSAEALPPEQADRFGLTPDAQDPTQRNLEAGFYRWKEAPETEGTYSPNSPNRRKVGGPNDG